MIAELPDDRNNGAPRVNKDRPGGKLPKKVEKCKKRPHTTKLTPGFMQ